MHMHTFYSRIHKSRFHATTLPSFSSLLPVHRGEFFALEQLKVRHSGYDSPRESQHTFASRYVDGAACALTIIHIYLLTPGFK